MKKIINEGEKLYNVDVIMRFYFNTDKKVKNSHTVQQVIKIIIIFY